MKDTIYRADAIEAVRKELVCDGRHETHDKTCRFIADVLLPALPSAEAVQGWIPCSERLQSDDEYVIVSVLDDHGDTPWKYTTVAWLCNGVWISDNDVLCGTPVAWMPLPKPYKGGDDE